MAIFASGAITLVQSAASAQDATVRIALTWSGRSDLDLIVVDPAGRTLGSEIVRHPDGEHLTIPAAEARGRWLVCVTSRRGRSEFQLEVQVGSRTSNTRGRRDRPDAHRDCTEDAPTFVTAISLGEPRSAPPEPTTSPSSALAPAPPSGPSRAGVALNIVHDERGEVPVSISGGSFSSACTTPCNLQLDPGTYEISSGRGRRALVLTAGEHEVEIDQGYDRGLFVGYVASAILGYGGIAAGGVLGVLGLLGLVDTPYTLVGLGLSGVGLAGIITYALFSLDKPGGGVRHRAPFARDWSMRLDVEPLDGGGALQLRGAF